MATKGQILDMTPVGMKFRGVKSTADTDGKSLDLHWELLPGCNIDASLVPPDIAIRALGFIGKLAGIDCEKS